jgi:uncharacterized protein YndB with AHSA1/START domain
MTSTKPAVAENLADREIAITRVFDARREMIWDAWTDPKQVVRWWGPRAFTKACWFERDAADRPTGGRGKSLN